MATAGEPARRAPTWRTYSWLAIAATLLAGVGAALVWRASETRDADDERRS